MLIVEVFARHYSYKWMQESMTMIDPSAGRGPGECYTIAHLAVKGRFYRLLHDVCFDTYQFDADFYRPKAKLTLLHVVAKYVSYLYWVDKDKEQLKRLVSRCSNLTL